MWTLPLFKKYWLYIALALVVATVCWLIWKPSAPKQETYHAEAKQKDGSVVAEVKPDASAKPAHMIPKGGTVERVVKVTVKPKPLLVAEGSKASVNQKVAELSGNSGQLECPLVECPPVNIELSLVRMPDESRRVVASSPDGEILSAVDIPVEAAAPVPEPKLYAAGVSVEPFKRTLGAWVDRDIGFLRSGAEVNQLRNGSFGEWDIRAKVGIRF